MASMLPDVRDNTVFSFSPPSTDEEPDAVLRLGSHKSWKIHTRIVVVASQYLQAMFMGGFQESSTKIVDLDAELLADEAITAVLAFLYSGTMDAKELVSHDDDPLGFLMKVWVAADYFMIPKLLASLATAAETQTTFLGRELALPAACFDFDDPAENTGRNKYDEILYKAIDQLERYRSVENYAVLEMFQPTITRLILCARHRFSTRSLCRTHPELVNGWEIVLDRPRLQFPHYARPAPNAQCPRCNKDLGGAMNAGGQGVNVILDMLRREMGGLLVWYCEECYTVPSLEEWQEVAEMYRIDKEEAILKQQYEELREVLLKQRTESWGRLHDASQTGSSNDVVWESED